MSAKLPQMPVPVRGVSSACLHWQDAQALEEPGPYTHNPGDTGDRGLVLATLLLLPPWPGSWLAPPLTSGRSLHLSEPHVFVFRWRRS